MRSAAALAGALGALAVLLAGGTAGANGDPDLEWWTIETEHFRVHHPHTLEPIAARVAALAETVHGRLTRALGYTPSSVTEVVLTDDTDAANGSATALPFNTVRLFVTAPDDMSPLGDYDDWYLELVTHEYTHILHTDNIAGVPTVINKILGKTYSPNQVQPRWILEGLAVLEETEHSSAGRLRSTLFDMFLRADVLEDRIAGLDQISSTAQRWPQGNLWYLYGSRFLGWISEVYGPDTMRAVAADYGDNLVPWAINRAIRRATGRTYEQLYDGFQDHLRRRYAAQAKGVTERGRREGVRLTRHGRTVAYPRFVPRAHRTKPDREELVYFRNDIDARSGIYRLPLGALSSTARRDEELVARATSPSSTSFTPAGDLVFSSTAPFKGVYQREDLFSVPRGETAPGGEEPWRRRLATGLRAGFPDVSPDGRSIVFVVNTKGTTYLEIATIAPDGTLRDRRDLVPSARFEQAYTPRFSPDGKLVAYSAWTEGGYRDIRLVDVATGKYERVTHDRAVDQQPVFSPDQKTLYFVSDRTGIANVYAYDLAAKNLRQVTNVDLGAYQPAVSDDGKTLVYTGYGSEGYDLYAMPLDPARWLEAPPPPLDRPDPPTEPSGIALTRRRYSPLPTLRPRSYTLEVKPGTYGSTAVTFSAQGSDVVGHHGLALSLVADPAAPEPQFSLDYSYRRLPVDFGARLFHYVAPRAGYRIAGRDLVYDEHTTGVTTGLSRPLPGEFSNHSLGLSYSVASFRGDLPVGNKLDPWASRTVVPPQGIIGVVHLGYGFSNVEGSLDASGPVRGFSLGVGVDFADDATASDFSLQAFEYSASTYVEMPWPGHHTLALRSAGAVAGGSYGRSGIYAVGGYDLESNSIIDTVTTGVFNGAFVLRGYDPRTYSGRAYILETAEYRFPIVAPDRGLSTLPLFLRRIDGNFFVDYGGAFNQLDVDKIRFFYAGDFIHSPQLHAAFGGELWFNATFGYFVSTQLRLGYAYGLSGSAIPGGQLYFVASSAF